MSSHRWLIPFFAAATVAIIAAELPRRKPEAISSIIPAKASEPANLIAQATPPAQTPPPAPRVPTSPVSQPSPTTVPPAIPPPPGPTDPAPGPADPTTRPADPTSATPLPPAETKADPGAERKPTFIPPKAVPAEDSSQVAPPPPLEIPPELSSAEPRYAHKKASLEKPPTAKTKDFFGEGSNPYTLSLAAAIRMALSNNLDSRVEQAGITLEEARVRNAYGIFDPVFSFSVSRGSTQTPDSRNNITSADAVAQIQAIDAQIEAINRNTLANQAFTNAILQALGRPLQEFNTPPLQSQLGTNDRIVFDTETDRGEMSIQARTPIGTIIRATSRLQKISTTFEGDPRPLIPNYFAFTGIEFRQPLLKDFGFDANLADLRIARKNRDAQRYTWQFRLENTLQDVVATYYEMIFGLNDLKNKADAITAGLRLVAHSERRRELGFFSPYEVKQAQVQLSFDRENLLLSKSAFLDRQYRMKRLVLAAYDGDDRRVMLPDNIAQLKVPKLNRDELLGLAFSNRTDYKAAVIGAEAEDVRLKFARNQLWPQLDVVGSFGWSGLDSSYPSATGQMMEGQAPAWTIGGQLSFPLGNIQPRAQLDAAKARKEQAILRVKSSELEVGISVERSIELIRTNEDRLRTAKFTTTAADEAVRVGFRRMEEGLITNFDLIEQQRRAYEARTRELAAIAELNRSITQLWLATGTVLQNLKISIADLEAERKPVKARPVRLFDGKR